MKKRQTFFLTLALTARGFLQTAKLAFMDKRFIYVFAFMALLLSYSNAWASTAAGTYSLSGDVLTISVNVATKVSVQTTGSGNYTFTLGTGTWTGSVPGATVSGTKLTVTSAATQNTINIVDGITGVSIDFGAHGVNPGTYEDNFNVTLDNGAAAVTFYNTAFSGSNALSVVTDRNILVYGQQSLTTVDGNLSLSANMQATQNVANFNGIEIGSIYQGVSTYVKSTGVGNVSLTGRGGASSSNTNRGVYLLGTLSYSSSIISGGGSVSVIGTGGGAASSTSNYGVYCENGVITSGGNGNLTVSGTGGGSTGANQGVSIAFTTISSGGDGSVTVTGTGTGTSGSDVSGVVVFISHITSVGNGAVQVTGQGATACTGGYNHGVIIRSQLAADTSSISSGGGNITVIGTGGGTGASSDNNYGISVGEKTGANYGFIRSGGNGSVTVTGTGGNATGANNYGVYVKNGLCDITASGTGELSITGNGGGSGTSSSNYGIYLGGHVKGNGVTLNGYGGTQVSGNQNIGVYVSSYVCSTGAGVVSVNGTGGGSDGSTDNYGVDVYSNNNFIGSISSNVTVTGIGGGTLGTGSSNSNYGVYVYAYPKITGGGSGTVTVIGTGGGKGVAATNNYGIYNNLGTITSGGGDVILEGHEGAGTAAIAISSNALISTLTNGGILTLKGNSLNSTYPVQVPAGTGILNVIPATAAVNINLGLASDVSGGPIAMSASEFNGMSGGLLHFGNANTGTITISAAMTPASGSSIKLTTAPTGGVVPSFTGTDLSLTSGKTLSFGSGTPIKIDITGNVANTSYQQLKVGGTVDLTGSALSLSGSYTPVDGDVFTIVSATAVTGTFTGLAEGSQVTFNGKSLRINYTATGVTLTAVAPAPTVEYPISSGDWAETGPRPLGNRFWQTASVSSDGSKMITSVTGGGRLYLSTDVSNTWSETGPTPLGGKEWFSGSISTDGMKMIEGVWGGRIYSSSDGGTTWSEIGPAPLSDKSWVTVAVSGNGNKLLAGVNNGRLFLSSDGGTTWTETQPSGATNRTWRVTSISTDGSIMLAGVIFGRLYKSTNGGSTWTETGPSPLANKDWISTSISSDGSKMLAGAYSGRLYMSTDAGITWSETGPTPFGDKVWITVSMSSDGNTMLAGIENGRLYKSTDGGTSWSETQPAGNSDKKWQALSISSDGNKMLAGASNGRLYKSVKQVLKITNITATTATGNGKIANLNGGANATSRGVIYYPYTGTDKVIGDGSVTNISENGSFATVDYTASLTGLAANAHYNLRAHATNSASTGYSDRSDFWTLANVPTAPTVNNPTATTLDVAVNVNGNPAATEFAIYETTQSKFVQANGTLGASAVWQTAANWGTKTVAGLTTGSTYTFEVKARNGENTETAYGATASGIANPPMQLKFTTTGASQRIYLPLYGTVNCTVNWGDGSATQDFTTTGNKLHTFDTAGTYTVTISGTLTHFGYYNDANDSGWSGSGYLTEVINFGNIGLTSLSGAFSDADNLTSVPATIPSTVTDLTYCFVKNNRATITNLDLWNVSNVTDMTSMFENASAFNQAIGNWNVSKVTSMNQMFYSNWAFNQPIGNWNVSSVTDMANMFRGATVFNQPIGNWIVTNVTDMTGMFETAQAFNQPIGNWNVGKATSMQSMFNWAKAFNQDIGNWNVSKVTDMSWMFDTAIKFDQKLGTWNIGSVTSMDDMFNGVTLSTANYDAILIGWAAQAVNSGVTFSGGNSKYSCGAIAARAVLTGIPKNWTITDGGALPLTWDGSASSDWNNTANWSCNAVPTATDNVLIPDVTRDPIVNLAAASPAECNNLTIESGAVLTISAGKALTVNGTLTNNAGISGLVVQSTSDASDGTGSLINGTAGVPGTVERYVSGDLWHLISPAATAGETVINFVGATQNTNLIARNANNYALAPWLETTGLWDYYKVSGSNTSGQFGTPAKGYQVMRTTGAGTGNGTNGGSGKLTFKGTLAAADQSIAVTKSGFGWNLVGNPYPCALDVAAFIAANTALLDPSYQFIYVSKIADITTHGYDPNTSGLKLASGEGFFVRTKAGGGNISFTTAMKSNVADAFKAATVAGPVIRLTAENGNSKLGTTVEYIGGATKGLDPGKDGGLFNGIASSFSLFTRLIEDNGVDFTVQSLPGNNLETMVVPVGLVADKGTTVTFKAVATNLPVGYKVYLEDKETAAFTRLDEANSSYTVSLNAATNGTGRFYLHTTEIVSAIDESLLSKVKVVPVPEQNLVRIVGNFDLPAKAMVYDMNGKLVATSALASQIENDIPLTNCATGIYLLKVDYGKDVETVKFVWKRK